MPEPLRITERGPRLEILKSIKDIGPTNVGIESSVGLNPIQLIADLQSMRADIVRHGVQILERILCSALRNAIPWSQTIGVAVGKSDKGPTVLAGVSEVGRTSAVGGQEIVN